MAWDDSADAVRRVAKSKDYRVRAIVADRRTVPADTLHLFATDPVESVRMRAAFNENADPETLFLLSNDSSPEIRSAVATNPSLPPQVFSVLVEDIDSEVRANLASNRSAPHEILEVLSEDFCHTVRLSVLYNPATCPSVLKKFADDRDCFVYMSLPEIEKFPEVAGLLLKDRGVETDGLPAEWVVKLLSMEFSLTCDCDYHSTPQFPQPAPRFTLGTLSKY